jgi:DNA-binding response OmpR family regulator
VSDTGPGIPPDHIDRIFEPFSQLADEPGHNGGGSGLGLSISKQFVELHNGRMWVESELNAGTTFFVDLPVSGSVDHLVRPGHQIKEEWVWVERKSRPKLPDAQLKPRMVLCDESGSLGSALARCTDEIEFVDTRALPEAIEELERCPAEALVLNAARPDSLWPVVERAVRLAPHTPIVGCSYPPQVERALRAGAIDYLIKPFTRAQVRAAIEAVDRPVTRVLLVDDDPDTRELLTLYIQTIDNEIKIATAASGEQALREMRSRPPDLIFLDIVLPDIDGWQVLHAKGEDEALREIPAAILSAQDVREGPVKSKVLLTAMGGGLSPSRFLTCSTSLVKLLLEPG